MYGRMCDVYGEVCVSQKKVYKGAKRGFVTTSSGRKDMLRKHWFPEKKFRLQLSVKKVMLIVFWNMKALMTIDFHEKGATANSAFRCQFPWQYLSLFIKWSTCIYIGIYIYIYIYIWLRMHTCMHVNFVCTYIYVCVCVCSSHHDKAEFPLCHSWIVVSKWASSNSALAVTFIFGVVNLGKTRTPLFPLQELF